MLKRTALQACLLLLTGMTVGATVAVLFAPDPGAKTRKRLGKYVRRTAEDLWEQGEEAIEMLRIEERNISKQAKRKQKRRYKQLLKQSKRISCRRLAELQRCRLYQA